MKWRSDVRKKAIYVLAAATFQLGGGVAHAQFPILTDIGVTLTATPTSNLVPGQFVDFTLTVTNYGPQATSLLVLDSSHFTNEIAQFVTNPSECYLVATIADAVEPYAYISWYVAGLPGQTDFLVGETLTCHFQFALSAQAPASWPFTFSVSTFDPDINSANDVGTVTLRRAVAAVSATPVPVLSPATWFLLVVLLAASACRASYVARSSK